MTKILYLNGITSVPNASGEKKIEKAKSSGRKNDINGYSKEFWDDLGIVPIDSECEEVERDEFGNIVLEESDIEQVYVDVAIPMHLFGGCEDTTDGVTICYTTWGYQFTVAESTEEITSYIEYLNSSWFEKKKAAFIIFWRNKFEKLKNK